MEIEGVCILIAEDEAVTLLGAQLAFEAAGYPVATAAHGQAAIDHVASRPLSFVCLVTDFHMPGSITGADVVEHMRPYYPAIPMIITTARPNVVSEGWRLHLGVRLVLKPYDLDALVKTVERLLAA